MLRETVAGNADEQSLSFSASLALQCFTNEYVYQETVEEKEIVDDLQGQIAALLKKKHNVPPSFVVALGAYRPLHLFPWAEELSDFEWHGRVKDVIVRQILEPREEVVLRSKVFCLTAITDIVSQSVRDQYEENPYPRWVKAGTEYEDRTLGAVLQGPPMRFDIGDYQSPASPEILVAGCGTGQHALLTASRFSNARVLAVDLSMSSLGYALRKTNERGLSSIEYAQADIMELGNLDRQFDHIECIGVLHHLRDTLAEWRILVDLLKPAGLMKIGLYSETARRNIVQGRSYIAKMGYSASRDDIRRCRQDIMAKAKNGDSEMAAICACDDFFNLSNCRDLLFHVQEHRFTLPQIAEVLEFMKLKFIGFEMRDQSTLRKFEKSFPQQRSLCSLSKWHEFERDNPNTFGGMYQFWCMSRNVQPAGN
jgi:2-polyprenyl-3-methyl-5-hydroxy-6-metoxy-1,4-benzoquinol methylase